jgi:MFS transporter, DHA1 family, multidrug resistance protein
LQKLDKRIFATLFFSIFATVTGVGIVVPLLPVYANDLGASGLYIALIFGGFSLSRTLFLPYFGRLSDKKGRRPFIVIGLFAYTIVSAAFLFSESVESLILVRFVQGIASAMIMPVVQAYVGDITPKGREGFVMGVFNMSLFFGLSAGPLLGGFINDYFNLEMAFACMGFLALVGFCLSFFLLPPTASEKTVRQKGAPVAWKLILADSNIAGLFLFRFTYTACIGIIWGFLPVLAEAEFKATSASIGMLVMLGVFVSGLLNTPLGYLADRVNKSAMVLIGGVVVCYTMFSFYSATSFDDLWYASLIFGLGGGIAMPAHMAIAIGVGNKTAAMGSVMALLTMAHSLGMMVGSLIAGIIMDLFALRPAFLAGLIFMVVGTGLFLFFTSTGVRKQTF